MRRQQNNQLLQERARRLHGHSVVMLTHDHLANRRALLGMLAGGVTAKVLHLTIDALIWEFAGRRYVESQKQRDGIGWRALAMKALRRVRRIIDSEPDIFALIRTPRDILAAKRHGKAGIILGFEGAKPLEGTIEALHEFHALGVRVIQLTWAVPNLLVEEDRDAGLTPFGRQVIREMNRLGMIVDIAHLTYLSRRAFFQAVELSEKPVMAGHNTVRPIAPQGELDDDQVRAIAAKGGIIGLHFCSHLVSRTGDTTPQASLDELVDQVDHIASLAGIDHVALGADFFRNDKVYARCMGTNVSWVKGADSVRKIPNVTRALVRRGFSDSDIKKVLGANFLRVFNAVQAGSHGD
jgi:membrane dipeptidase